MTTSVSLSLVAIAARSSAVLQPRVASREPLPLVLVIAGSAFALVALRRDKTRSGFGEHRVVVRRLVIGRERDPDTLFGCSHHRADAGIADQIPADEIGVAAVKRIAERALNGVGADKSEKPRRQAVRLAGLDVHQDRVLIGRFQSENAVPRDLMAWRSIAARPAVYAWRVGARKPASARSM